MIMAAEKVQFNNKKNWAKIDQFINFVYLGHKLYCKNYQEVVLKHRISLGWAAFRKYKGILKSTRLALHIKMKIYLIRIFLVVLYILDCMAWTQKFSAQIKTFQNHMICILTDHKLIIIVKITISKNVNNLPSLFDTISSKSLEPIWTH